MHHLFSHLNVALTHDTSISLVANIVALIDHQSPQHSQLARLTVEAVAISRGRTLADYNLPPLPSRSPGTLQRYGLPLSITAIGSVLVYALLSWLVPKLVSHNPSAPIVAEVGYPALYPADQLQDGQLFHWEHGPHRALHVVRAPANVPLQEQGFRGWDRSGQFRTEWKANPAYFVEGFLMMDAESLYVGAHVGDPLALRNANPPVASRDGAWAGGALQLRLATNASAKGAYDNVRHLTLYVHQGQVYLHIVRGLDFATLVPPSPSGSVGFVAHAEEDTAGTGYHLKARLTWALLGFQGAPFGKKLPFCWETTWADPRGSRCIGKLTDCLNTAELHRLRRERVFSDLYPGQLSYQQPSIWGTALCPSH